MEKRYMEAIQCRDSITGKTGCFMFEVTREQPDKKAESPIFESFSELIIYRNIWFVQVDTVCGNPYLPIFERIDLYE